MTKVETYIPNPLRCHNYQKFGHHKEKCTRPPICKNCGETRNHIDCQQPPKCANCKQNHSADSEECELWRKEKRILEVKHTKNISYPEVRKFICLQEIFKKRSDKLNIKTFEQYDYIHSTGQRAPGGVSILIRKDIPPK